MLPEVATKIERDFESVGLQIDVVCLSDKDCANMKMLVKNAPSKATQCVFDPVNVSVVEGMDKLLFF